MNKKKRRLRVNLILSLIVVVLVGIMIYCIFDIINNIQSKSQSSVEVLDKIDGYDYELNENDSAYFESLFSDLKKTLEEDEIAEEAYATLISQLFITDFYSLESAINKNDVGGTQFVYSEYKEDFISKAKTSVYNYVENNIYGDREQELPMVTDVSINSVETQSYSFENSVEDDSAYVVTVSVSYSKDLGYPTEVTMVLVHNENKLEVAKMN